MENLFESNLQPGFHAISEEEGSISNFSIARLFGIKVLENIQDKISKATGLAFVTVDYRGEPITEMTSFTPFCRQVRRDENAKRICMSSDAFGAIQAAVTQKTYVYFCPCGLIEIAIPIIVRGHYLGGFIGGQIRCEDAPTDICRLESVLHHTRNHREDPEMNELFQSIAVYPYEKFFHIANLVSLIVNQLAEKELSRLVQKENLDKELEALNEQKKEMEAELAALKTQMNPYFLFKSLNAISNLSVVEDAPRTNRAINLFAEFMKFNFSETKDNVFVPDEIENLERYLKIQKERMGEQLQYVLDMSEELNMQKIPSRILLPFVERAVFYGVGQKREPGTLRISARYQEDDVVLQVEDDGPGLSDKKIAQLFKQYKGFYEGGAIEASIAFSRQRLVNSFGSGYDAVIKSVDGVGTTSTVRYPKNFDEKAN
ncbi:sensor histidine kinase [Faecalispora anaeroviscerum]|uniref:sensor histidine kinase n=1 Tax=Faecalispora anaeroviscerum TaxID=2991836 RepID=UPI0024BB9743|nr:PocR ligand-binding domain-containing protein [Faecalispora anaeroviscerum]